jgi:hypothetical protein
VETLAGLRERRAFECRLTPDRALTSLAEAEAFLLDRGLLTRTPDCALPSLYEACHEEPYQAGGHGFAGWPATKWPWFSQLAEGGYLVTAVHRGKNLLVGPALASLLDPICRAELTRMRAEDRGWARLLDHLAEAGPSTVDDLCLELSLKRPELRKLRAPLERCGAIVARSVEEPGVTGHVHTSVLARWDQAYPGSTDSEQEPVPALGDLLVACVRAAVLASEAELGRWFSWRWYWSAALVSDLARAGRLRRAEGYVWAAE